MSRCGCSSAPAWRDAGDARHRPGNDRAQSTGFVAVDQSTRRAHVVFYDQDVLPTGDLIQVLHTYSDDQGATWSPPTPLTDRPFHAAYAMTAAVPTWRLPPGRCLRRQALHRVRSDVRGAALRRRSGAGAGVLDDLARHLRGRHRRPQRMRRCAVSARPPATRCFALPAVVTAPRTPARSSTSTSPCRTTSSTRRTARRPSPGSWHPEDRHPGRHHPRGVRHLRRPRAVGAGEQGHQVRAVEVVRARHVHRLRAGRDDHQPGSIALPIRVPTGTPGTPQSLLNETFTTTSINPAWTQGPPSGGRASSATPAATGRFSRPSRRGNNAAFHSEAPTAYNLVLLVSPRVSIPTMPLESYVSVDFDIAYNLEDDPGRQVRATMACSSRSSILRGIHARDVLAEAFAESIRTGAANHYPKRLPRDSNPNYMDNMSVWSGRSGALDGGIPRRSTSRCAFRARA